MFSFLLNAAMVATTFVGGTFLFWGVMSLITGRS